MLGETRIRLRDKEECRWWRKAGEKGMRMRDTVREVMVGEGVVGGVCQRKFGAAAEIPLFRSTSH